MTTNQYQNILFIRFRGIGDVLLSTPAVHAFREANPKARIVYLTEKEAAEALYGNPDIDDVLVYPRDKTRKVSWKDKVHGLWSLVGYFLSHRFDLCLDFRGDVKSVIFSLLSKARLRVGYEYRVRQWFYSKVIRNSLFPKRLPAYQFYLKAAEGCGCKIGRPKLIFQVSAEARKWAEKFLKEQVEGRSLRLAGFNPGGTHPAKLWPLSNFIGLAEIIEKRFGLVPVFFAGPYENQQARQIADFLERKKGVLVRPKNLQHYGALLQKCRIFISNDSGPLHLAEALAVPTLGLFGGSDPEVWFAYGKEQGDLTAGNLGRDIKTVTVGEVLDKVKKLISKRKL